MMILPWLFGCTCKMRRRGKHTYILLLLLCFTVRLGAEDVGFVHFNKSNSGLSFNGVRTLIKDSRGCLWFGTHMGLSVYDGKTFRNFYRKDLGIDSDFIVSLMEDDKGNVWIGTDKGVAIYDLASSRFRSLKSVCGKSVEDRIFSLCCVDGVVWIGSRQQGLFRWDGKTFERVVDGGLGGIFRIEPSASGGVWIAVYCNNIYSVDADGENLVRLEIKEDADYFQNDDVQGLAVVPRKDSLLYVASKTHGLCEVNLTDSTVSELVTLPQEHRPTNLFNAGDDVLWLSSTAGVYRYDLKTDRLQICSKDDNDLLSLSDDYVNDILYDEGGDLWVATFNEGVNYHSPSHDLFRKYYRTSQNESPACVIVKGMAEDDNGNLWVATEAKGLFVLEDGILEKITLDGLPGSFTALGYGQGYIWAGTSNGVIKLDPDTRERVASYHTAGSSSQSENRIVSFFFSKDSFYTATALGVWAYNPVSDSFERVQGLENLTIENMAEDEEGRIWMASYSNGVYCYVPSTGVLRNYCAVNGNSEVPGMTTSILCDYQGRIWLTSFSSGLYLYDSAKDDFVPYDAQKSARLPYSVFYSALPDRSGNLFLASNVGLVVLNPETGRHRSFGIDDGILDNTFKKAAVELSDGSFAFGSDYGVTVFNPSAVAGLEESGSEFSYYEEMIGDRWLLYLLGTIATLSAGVILLRSRRRVVPESVTSDSVADPVAPEEKPAGQTEVLAEDSHKLINEGDADFVRRIDEIIEANISNPEFSSIQLEEALFMSRSTLIRKVRAVLDTTPNDYLNSKRLAAAAQLLAQHRLNVKEVSFAVGIKSPSYFSKLFKEKYGMLPSEFMEKR